VANELVHELICDLLWLNSITLSRSQTWFPTCCRLSQTGSGHIPLRYLAR